MSKKILIPLDGSNAAEKILPLVHTLTNEPVNELVLLHVIEYPHELYPDWVKPIREKKQAILRDRQAYLAGVAAQLAMLGYTVSAEICEGPVVQAIIHTAQRLDVDFIAISTYGSGGHRCSMSSSIANRVLHEAKTPVMVIVHPEQDIFRIEPAMLYRAVLAGQTVDV